MLPRAVGYARGVLDYFFRGSVRVWRVTAEFDGIWIVIENTSEERMEGVFEVYPRYDKGTPHERRDRVATVNGGAAISLDPGDAGRFALDLSPVAPTPDYILVFRGRLGAEEDAVAGQVFAVPHVRIVQHSYTADITKTCTTLRGTPGPGKPALQEVLRCSWEPINHRVGGSLVTNLLDSDVGNAWEPAIERMEAGWLGPWGDVRGPAPLAIDGVDYPDGIWLRQGHERNPETFVVADPAARQDSSLWISVFVRGADRPFQTQMATFGRIYNAAAVKMVNWLGHERKWRLISWRDINVKPDVFAGQYSIASIGGYPVPTTRRSARETLHVNATRGVQTLVDVLEMFPPGSEEAYEAAWAAIELTAPFPEPPDLHWSAVVVSRPPSPVEARLWRAVVPNAELSPISILLTGRDAGAP